MEELWDGDISIAEEKLVIPSIFSGITCTESDRITLRGYGRETYQSHGNSDATDSIYFNSLAPHEPYHSEINASYNKNNYVWSSCQSNLTPKDGRQICSNDLQKACSAKSTDHDGFVTTDSIQREKDLAVNSKITGRSHHEICRHSSKAFTIPSSAAKDRHSKVNTAKGPRDRRVRLSVSAALQFYDIQDRLGLNQPSKVLDWLMNKAKAAIDELPGPSYMSTFNCAACISGLKNTPFAPDELSTSAEKTNCQAKQRCSPHCSHSKDLSEDDGPAGASLQRRIMMTKKRGLNAYYKECTRDGEESRLSATSPVLPISVSQTGSRTTKRFVHSVVSKLDTLSPLKIECVSREKNISMLNWSKQQSAQLDIFGNRIQFLESVEPARQEEENCKTLVEPDLSFDSLANAFNGEGMLLKYY